MEDKPTVVSRIISLPVVPILLLAFRITWQYRVRLAQVVAIPSLALALIGTYWSYYGYQAGTYNSILWVLLHMMAFTPFTVACHRVLLLSENSLPRYGILSWTKREVQFLKWLLVVMLSGWSTSIIATMLLGTLMQNAFEFPEDWWAWLISGCTVLGAYVAARFSLSLPIVAIDKIVVDRNLGLADLWRATRGNGWRLTVVLGGFPWLLRYGQRMLFPEDATIATTVLFALLYCVLLVVEVAALSLSYKALNATSFDVSWSSRDRT